jgi:ribosomal protein L37AE/L43A
MIFECPLCYSEDIRKKKCCNLWVCGNCGKEFDDEPTKAGK